MIFLSYNCRGLANLQKKSSIKRMVAINDPHIILLQETMGASENVKKALESWLSSWVFEVVDAIGKSGGLAIGWLTKQIGCENIWEYNRGLVRMSTAGKQTGPLLC